MGLNTICSCVLAANHLFKVIVKFCQWFESIQSSLACNCTGLLYTKCLVHSSDEKQTTVVHINSCVVIYLLFIIIVCVGTVLATLSVAVPCEQLTPTAVRGFIKGQAPGKLTVCEQDLAINLPGCFCLLFFLS